MYKLCVFDLDGTLLNSIEDLANAGNYALSSMSLPTHSIEDYKLMVGYGVDKMMENMLPKNANHMYSRLVARELFDRYYSVHDHDTSVPYPGILDMLKELKKKDIRIAVLSNKPDEYVQQIVAEYYPNTFDMVSGVKKGGLPKPNPMGLRQTIEYFGFMKSECIMIGDTKTDMQTAQNAGIQSCGVEWGFRSRAELEKHNATYIVKDTNELLDIIFNSNHV